MAARLAAALQDLLQQTDASGITAAVGGPGLGLWWQTRGLAHKQPAVAADDHSLFSWDSVGKAYTAALVLGAVQQQRLRLDDPISRWWPQFPQAQHVTLAHLLTHTSGIHATEFSTPPTPQYRAPDELIAQARDAGSLFCPGGYWRYSNSGYVMLGRALELSEGTSYGQLLEQRLFAPLGLQHSAFVGPGTPPPGLVTPHPGGLPDDNPGRATPFAAGAVAARADDVLRFWHALLTGRLLPQATVQASYERLMPMFDNPESSYGRGVMLNEWTDSQGRQRRWLGHLGGGTGSNAVVAYDPRLQLYVAVAINSKVSAPAAARRLLETVEHWR